MIAKYIGQLVAPPLLRDIQCIHHLVSLLKQSQNHQVETIPSDQSLFEALLPQVWILRTAKGHTDLQATDTDLSQVQKHYLKIMTQPAYCTYFDVGRLYIHCCSCVESEKKCLLSTVVLVQLVTIVEAGKSYSLRKKMKTYGGSLSDRTPL